MGGEIEQSIGDVVRNLIARKDYDTAKDICNKYLKQSKDEEIDKYIKNIKRLKNEIRYSEISDIVMKAINMKGTEKEEKEYIELIEKGLNMGNVELSAISLGKSKDGVKNITLKDIWIDESKLR